jgi:ABC-type Mn2+/Zn2+ transport system ATPase subunit
MEFEITLKNYRCFPDSSPARMTLSEGFIALIGVNNSGKSSLLKFFYEFRALFRTLSTDRGSVAAAIQRQPRDLKLGSSVSDADEIFNNQNDRDIQIAVRVLKDAAGKEPGGIVAAELRVLVGRSTKKWTLEVPGFYSAAQNAAVSIDGAWVLSNVNGGVIADLRAVTQVFELMGESLYIGPFRNAINAGGSQDYYDITVGQRFIEQWRQDKTGPIISRNEAIIQLTEDIRRIFEFNRLEIDASEDGINLKVFVNNKSFRLTELGAGLSQFILVLANAAILRRSLMLIDEPELNLHPSLQIDFLTTLASYSRVLLIFGTHSIGLARATAHRIYSLRRISEGHTEVRDFETTPQLAEFVGELGYSGYQELGYDKILLVEGPTDVTVFQQFLRIYNKDHKVVLLPLGGRSFITRTSEPQLAELTRISSRIVAVIDSERRVLAAPLAVDRQGFVEACKALHITCHVLERRATESYFTDRAVKAAMGPNFRGIGPYGELSAASPSWNKRENWRIAREMTREELDGTDLGAILSSV